MTLQCFPFIRFWEYISVSLSGYHAPLDVYGELSRQAQEYNIQKPVNLCVGKEWYRFPSSFFLPDEK